MNKIAIILIHWRDQIQTQEAIDKILAWKNLNFELIIVQNETISNQFTHITDKRVHFLKHEKNLGFGGANNLGFEFCKTRNISHIFLLNTDASIAESELSKLFVFAQSQEKLFSCGPSIYENYEQSTKQFVGGKNIAYESQTRILFDESHSEKASIDVDYNIGAAILINYKALQKVGYFDEDYFFSGEVCDICYRAKQLEFKCKTYLEVKAFHYPATSDTRATLYKYYSLRNRLLFIRKHPLLKKYKWSWYKLLIKESLYQLFTFNFPQLKTISITIFHSLFNISGNQNRFFKF